MDNDELRDVLLGLDSAIDYELRVLFESSPVFPIFSFLVRLSVLGDDGLDSDILEKVSFLTDDMDVLNFGVVKDDIVELLDLLD